MNQSTHKCENSPYVEKHQVIFGHACKQFLSFALHILEFGKVSTQNDDSFGERFVHHHRLNYICEGHPYYIEGTERIDLEPGCLVFMPPNTTLHIDESTETLKLLFINFELGSLNAREEFHQFMSKLFPDRHVHDKNDELKKIFEMIYKIGVNNEPGVALEIQNLFENLFLHVFRLSQHYPSIHSANPATGSNTIFESAMNYINANLQRGFRISEMAEALNISENYLYKVFMKQIGESPSAFTKKIRIDLAKSSLANPNLSVKVIASHLGYESVSHFSATFKKEVGVSPASFRRGLLSR